MAGCYDRPWGVGSKARGTRSQFRLNTEGLLPFKCTYPVHLTDVMDAVPSTQGEIRRGELTSPVKATRTRTVREYEQLIEDLRKENFDLKLSIFLLEERIKPHQKKGLGNDNQDNTINVVVELKEETDSLKKELSNKDNLLQAALDQTEKYASDVQKLQEQLVAAVPDWERLKEERNNLSKETAHLINVLSEKDKEIKDAKAQIEELSNQNEVLEAKVNKRSLAIQGIVYKYYKDIEMIPKELRPIVQVAVKAAKESKEEDLNAAVVDFKASLCKIMPTSVYEVSRDSEEKENESPSKKKTSVMGVQKLSLPVVNESSGESSQFHRLPDTKTKFVHVNEENFTIEDNLSHSSESMDEYSKLVENESGENLEQLMNVVKENDSLKTDNEEKSRTIKDLDATCSELERRNIQLQSELSEAVSKIKNLEIKFREEKSKRTSSLPKLNSSVQTAVQWHLIQSKLSDSFLQDVDQSNNADELKEEIIRLLLVIEQKEKEVSDIEQQLDSVQLHLEKVENRKDNTFSNMDIDYIIERNDLHQRLALSCTVNQELMEQLRKLETFMEDLLLHKNLDSSSKENINEASSVLSRLTSCLDETKKLSNVLSDHLSVCEGSRIFDPNDVSVSREDFSQSDIPSYHLEDQSRLSLNASNTHPASQGRNNFQPSISESYKNAAGTGKRRLSFSTLHNSARNCARIDSDNVVVLGTSNNEDLILLLNDKGDPEDVLIRNNLSHLNQNATLNNGDQLRRRCWESSSMSYWNGEKSTLDQGCTSELWNPKRTHNRCPSSDSDIWSEPDRDISLQRIGIDVQKSPVTQKSPRRSRLRDRCTTDEHSSPKNESSSSAIKLHSWSKRRKSSETLRSSFICKKCLFQSLTKDEKTEKDQLQKVINDLSNRCSKQENQLENKIQVIDTLTEEKQELSDCINRLKEELQDLREKQSVVTREAAESSGRVTEINSENNKLRNAIQTLELKAADSDAVCERLKNELEQTKTRLQTLDLKCSQYEKDLSLNSKTVDEYLEKYNSVKDEKVKLLNEIEALVSEKNELLQAIQIEKERFENEISQLNEKLESSSKSVSSLQARCEELEITRNELLKEKEVTESNLLSSNSICDKLGEDLKKTQESLHNLKGLCTTYEKELEQSSEVKENIIYSLSNVKNLFLSNLNSLIDVCKQYLECEEEILNDNLLSGRVSTTDKGDQIEELFAIVISANTKFEQTIHFLSDQLSSVSSIQQQFEINNSEIQSLNIQNNQLKAHIQTLQHTVNEDRSLIKEYKTKIDFLQQELDNAQIDMETLKKQKEEQQTHLQGVQQALKDKDKSLEYSNSKLSSSEMQLNTIRKQVEKDQHFLNLKDDEITKLQERIFNLQSQLNSILSEKMAIASRIKLNSDEFSKGTVTTADPLKDSLNTSNLSETNVKCDTQSKIDNSESKDKSFSSVASERDEESLKSSDRYIRKIKALKTKLSLTEKRIEILEKEKCDLREDFLAQVHGDKKTSNSTLEEIDSLKKELSDLKEKLQAKSSFIKDLKSEMFKTCNSLVDKQKEVDDLTHKLSIRKEQHTDVKSGHSVEKTLNQRYSDPLQMATEENIKMLKKHKWELVQSIMKQQKQFYERKNIHLGHFEKFMNHIEKLRALQVSPTLFKSESEPVLNSSLLANNCFVEKCDKTLKNLQIELELDVEYLQNFKIFLKRFFIPLVLQNCDQCSKNDSATGVKSVVGDIKKNVSIQTKMLDNGKDWIKNPTLSYAEVTCAASDFSSNDRLITIASVVAHKIDSIESVLKSVKSLLENIKGCSDIGECPNKTAAQSLLTKLFDEISSQQEKMSETFHLNSTLKSLGLFDVNVPLSPSKQDMSDRESLLSEETITLSRSGSLSPASFDENLHFKSLSDKSEKTKPEIHYQENEKVNLENSSGLTQKSNITGGSQDSIFQRSHFSSPDLGIESDPNHESSAPEQAEKEDIKESISRLSKRHESGTKAKQWTVEKSHSTSLYGFKDRLTKLIDYSSAMGDNLHAIGVLQHYELLKKEVQESLVGVKAILSRTGDGLQHVAKYTSPRKNLEYSTFKAIRDASSNIEVCLEEAAKLVDKFWIAPCPSMKDVNMLIQQSHEQQEKLKRLEESKIRQENHIKEVMARLKQEEVLKEKMEKKISKKLVKTKKVIRQAEIKLLERDLPHIPKYPSEEPTCQKKL